ncbi:MAG: hypothetical protein ACUVRK_13155 [Spirochaetota bacterium]
MSFERLWHKNYPAQVPREINFDKITMPQSLTRSVKNYPDNIALIF